MQMWMLRSQGGRLLPKFLDENIVALGWPEAGDLRNKSRSDIKRVLADELPQKYQKSVPVWAGMLDSFANRIKRDDLVVTYDPSLRIYRVAKVTGDYMYLPGKYPETPNVREVKWFDKEISRDWLSVKAKSYLGSLMSLFEISKDIAGEITNLLNGKELNQKNASEKEQEVDSQAAALVESSIELLKEKILELSPYDMQELLKEILTAMGYIAACSPRGADLSKDVFASPDGLGLEEPRIFAEVKHREGKMGAPEVRKFIGGRKSGDKCLFVSTGGFTKEAQYEAERSSVPLTLIDLARLADLISLHYDNFRAEGRMLLPLKKVYLPILNTGEAEN